MELDASTIIANNNNVTKTAAITTTDADTSAVKNEEKQKEEIIKKFLKENHDYQLISSALTVLQNQLKQAERDVDFLEYAKKEALKDPISFLILLSKTTSPNNNHNNKNNTVNADVDQSSTVNLNKHTSNNISSSEWKSRFPKLQTVLQIPSVNFSKFPEPLIKQAAADLAIFSSKQPSFMFKRAPYAELQVDLGFNLSSSPSLQPNYHPSVDGPHNKTEDSLMIQLEAKAQGIESTETDGSDGQHALVGLRPMSSLFNLNTATSKEQQGSGGTVGTEDDETVEDEASNTKVKRKNKLKSRTIGRVAKDKVQYLPISVRISGANYLRRKRKSHHQNHNRNNDCPSKQDENNQTSDLNAINNEMNNSDVDNNSLIVSDASSEDDIDPSLKNSEDYQELMRLKRMRKERQGYIPPLNRGEQVHHGYSCDACLCHPIVGTRHTCLNCPEDHQVDLCNECVSIPFQNEIHEPSHKFQAVTISEKEDPMVVEEQDPYAYLGL